MLESLVHNGKISNSNYVLLEKALVEVGRMDLLQYFPATSRSPAVAQMINDKLKAQERAQEQERKAEERLAAGSVPNADATQQPSPPRERRATDFAVDLASKTGGVAKGAIKGAMAAFSRPFRSGNAGDTQSIAPSEAGERPRPGTSASQSSGHSDQDHHATAKHKGGSDHDGDRTSLAESGHTGRSRVKTPGDGTSGTAPPDHAMSTDSSQQSAPETQEEKKHRRRRHGLLNLYYGLGAAPKKTTKADPLDIDDDGFKAEMYMEKMMANDSFEQVVTRENEVASQMKGLDSEMQTLVYENYNKFISATDTVRKMKSQVDSMTDTMKNLAESMRDINTVNVGINERLSPQRDRIAKLSAAHITLKKLQFIFELPTRLKLCLEQKSYGQAVDYYTKVG